MVTTRSRTSGPFEQPHLDSPPPAIRATRSAAKAAKEPSAAKHPSSHDHTEEYEFFGPHVPFLLLFVLPAVLYALIFACNSNGCFSLYPLPIKPAPGFPSGSHIFSWEALAGYIGWFFGLVTLHLILPGTLAQGTVLKDGSRLQYKLNSFTLFIIAYGLVLYLCFLAPPPYTIDLGSWIYHHYLDLLTASIIFSTLLSFYLYFTSFKKGAMLSGHGSSSYPWYDFWMGRELNPRIGAMFDLKEFCELYPGLIGWAVINLCMAHRQYVLMGRITNSMVLTNLFQLYYVADGLWNERSILTTMDITTDGFGYMLAFGDLAWVPFGFTTIARFLVDYPQDLSPVMMAVVIGVKALGYYIFRGANGQKDMFRCNPKDPRVAHLKTLPTARGTKLIISGWWGMSRHINYLGDWIMGLSWCLPCGFSAMPSIVPYFYCLYFASLLIHRERRDDQACQKKYGKDWGLYCSKVKWRIVPYVY